MENKIFVHVWQTDYGLHEIPKEFSDVTFAKNGYPDKRYKRYVDIMKWVESLDRDDDD